MDLKTLHGSVTANSDMTVLTVLAEVVEAVGFVEDRSECGSNHQFKSPPEIKIQEAVSLETSLI